MSTTKRITLDELLSAEMPEDSKKRIRSAVQVFDKDNPPLTDNELKDLQPAINRHPEWFRPKKADVHLKIDIDVLEAFKAQGKGYQTRINEVLRDYVFNSKCRDAARE